MATAQHYVPQVYLRRFRSRHKKRQDYVYVFDKVKQKPREQATKEVAHENGFYDVTHSDGRTLSLDPQISHDEQAVMGAIAAVCEDRSMDTMLHHRPQLAYFIASQMTRTASFRALLRD